MKRSRHDQLKIIDNLLGVLSEHEDKILVPKVADAIGTRKSSPKVSDAIGKKSKVVDDAISTRSPPKVANAIGKKSKVADAIGKTKSPPKAIGKTKSPPKVADAIGKKSLRSQRGQIIDNIGQGDCLFHASIVWLNRLGLFHRSAKELRNLVCDWIEVNRDERYNAMTISEWIQSEYPSKSVSTYIKQMRNNAWGGEIELRAISEIFSVEINMWYKDDSNNISRSPGYDILCPPNVVCVGTIHLYYIQNLHYKAYIPH